MNDFQIAKALGISIVEVKKLLASATQKLHHTPTRMYYFAKWARR